MIDWAAFGTVFIAALVAATVVVSAYSLGLRLLSVSGRIPVVEPANFTDALTTITPAEAKAAAKRAKKAAKKSPLTEGQRRIALFGAYGCFALCAAAVVAGILIIVVGH